MGKPRRDLPNRLSLREILEKTKVKPVDINKLEDGLLDVTFFDTYTKSEKKGDIIKVYGQSITGEEDVLEINLKDKTLIYHETIGGVTRDREYTRNGFDLSKIRLM